MNRSKSCLEVFIQLVKLPLYILLFFPLTTFGQGNLLITPRRVVFEGSKRTQELNLANIGVDSAKYNVSIIQLRMLENGTVREITEPDPGQYFADKYIRFFPRVVSLGPREAQIVRMQLTRTDGLAPGEYRSHVYFRAVPKTNVLGEAKTRKDSASISIKIVPIFGIVIPVIIRIGQSDMKVNISDIKLETVNDSVKLSFYFNRTGNMSVFGNVKVDYIPPQGKAIPVGVAEGVAVYTPNTRRSVLMDLEKKPGVDYRKGTLHLTYSSQSDTRPDKYAENDFQIK